MGSRMAGAPALDAYLHQSFDLIQFVADNMGVIKAVASHLTPVEDLADFKATIDELYGKLDLLVEASELIIQTTPAGIQLLLAPDAASQRMVMGLGSAALKTSGYFAKSTDFVALSAYVDQIKLITSQLTQDMQARVTHTELATTVAGLQTRFDSRIAAILLALGEGQYTTVLNDQIVEMNARMTGQASAVIALTTKVETTAQGVIAVSAYAEELRTEVVDTKAQLAGNASAVRTLETRTSILDGVVTAQAEEVTALNAVAENLATGITSQADALQSLAIMASNTDGEQRTTAEFVTQLSGRITSTESDLAASVEATAALTTELAATKDGLLIAASDVTSLKSSVTGTGNLLPNAAFEVDTRAWTLFSRGVGWIASDIQLNLDPSRLPQALNVLSLTATGVPSGTAGIRSPKLPISAQTRYILSGYLAAENCTLRMEWRLFNAAGAEIGMGVVGSVTNVSPATNLVNWERAHQAFSTSIDAAQMEVHLWVSNCNTAPPKVWFLRPQMEEAVGTQTLPSPWAAGVSGLEEAMSSALALLTTRVEVTENGTLTMAGSLISLESRIGGGEAALAGVATAVQGMSTQVATIDGKVAAQATSITAINAAVGATNAAINSEATLRINADNANATNINNVTTTVGGHTASIASHQTSINGVMAKAGIALNVNGHVIGWTLNNNGLSGDMTILANKFSVVDATDGTKYLYFANGDLTVSGTVTASLIKGSAMEMASTRIHTSGDRLAPFVVKDLVSINGGSTWTNRTLMLADFLSPDFGSGYNWKRFAAMRMDVYIEALLSCDGPDGQSETVILEVQYDNGAWTSIAQVTSSSAFRSFIPMCVRYTTLDAWSYVYFRARTTQGHTIAMTLKVEVLNFNTSGNAPGSNSGLGGGGGAPPPPPVDDEYCVDWLTTVLPDGRYVRNLADGALVEVVNVLTGERAWMPLLSMRMGFEDCYRVTTKHGEIIQSKSTPMDMRDGSVVRTPDLGGLELLTHAHGWETAAVEFMGVRKVCKPDFGDRMFFAGTSIKRAIATHNVRNK